MSATCSIHIEAPVEKVFDFYKDPRKGVAAMWTDQMNERGELLDVKTTDEGVGTYYSWAMKLPGLRLEGFDVYTEFVPNQRITDRSSRSFVGTWTYTFGPEGSGTRLTHQRHPASSRARRAIDRLMDRFRVSVERQELEKLKVLLEKPAAPGPMRTASGRRSPR